jgi:hypothetical protein
MDAKRRPLAFGGVRRARQVHDHVAVTGEPRVSVVEASAVLQFASRRRARRR